MPRMSDKIDDSADCEDQALVRTARCTNWLCRDWRCRGPELVKDRRGFWVCPECKHSYGKDAK